MPTLAYGKTAYRRDNGDLPEQKLQNLLLEATPTDDEGVVLLARAGLEEHSTPGSSGAVKGIYSKAGLFSGDIFSVVGSSLYRGETLVDAVDGSGPVSFADNGIDELAVNAGGDIEVYDGATLTAASFPDSADVTWIGFVSGLYVATRKNTGKFYWSATLDATSWNALDFATAESQADNLLQGVVIGDVVWLLGQESIEAWDITGDADLPFRKVIGRSYQVGLIATGAAVNLKGRLCWVGNDARPYMDGQPIADEGLAERIRAGTTISCFEFTYEGHPIFCIRIEGGTSEGTWGFDLTTGSWLEFSSYLRDNWRVRTAFTKGSTVYLGDDELNSIWTFGGGSENGDPIQCVFSFVIPTNSAMQIDNIGLYANFGRAEALSDSGSNPFIELRMAKDSDGKAWKDWRPKSLGLMGEYRKRVKWNRCGMIDAPGGIGEIRSTDVTRLRVSGLTINEPGGGRGRQ